MHQGNCVKSLIGYLALRSSRSIDAKGSDIEVRHRTMSTAASFDPLVEQLRHFVAVIARREAPLISVEDCH
jgi:hypothetical protein